MDKWFNNENQRFSRIEQLAKERRRYWIIRIPKDEIKMIPFVIFLSFTFPYWLLIYINKRVKNQSNMIFNWYYDKMRIGVS